MSRLTKYRADIQAYDYVELCGGISQAVTNKLGKLEDLLQSYNVEDLEQLDKLLGMATTYEELSKQLGCPLEVRCAVVPDSYIYTFGTTMENQDVVTQRHIVTISKEGFTILYATATGKERKMELSWKAYKKTWWLKRDKSE